MISITVKFLGGMAEVVGIEKTTLEFAPSATLVDLVPRLEALGLDSRDPDQIIVLNGRGINQWPSDRRFTEGDVIAVLPLITGG